MLGDMARGVEVEDVSDISDIRVDTRGFRVLCLCLATCLVPSLKRRGSSSLCSRDAGREY
jgi:hypothetical protein